MRTNLQRAKADDGGLFYLSTPNLNKTLLKSDEGTQEGGDSKISAVVSSIGNLDSVNDRMVPGAFDKFLESEKGKIPVLLQHKRENIIGEWTDFKLDETKLIGDGNFFNEIPLADSTVKLYNRGFFKEVSIGFMSEQWKFNDDDGIDFNDVNIIEVSVVDKGANPMNEILDVKSLFTVRELEKILSTVNITKDEAKALISLMKELRGETIKQEDQIDWDAVRAELNPAINWAEVASKLKE